MKKILVPVDLNGIGFNALKYAIQRYPKNEIHVLHVEQSSLTIDDPLYVSYFLPNNEAQVKTFNNLICEKLHLKSLPDRIVLHVDYGDVVSKITNYIDHLNIDEVVMGTRDKYDAFDKWLGTISLAVVKKSKVPVMLIPKMAEYKFIDKVLVATDSRFLDKAYTKAIKSWNNDFRAYLKFLHIAKSEENFDLEKETIIQAMMEDDKPQFSFEIAQFYNDDVAHTLLSAAYNFSADMLVIAPGKQNFIQALFFKSLSKDLVLHARIPLYFLHVPQSNTPQNSEKTVEEKKLVQ